MKARPPRKAGHQRAGPGQGLVGFFQVAGDQQGQRREDRQDVAGSLESEMLKNTKMNTAQTSSIRLGWKRPPLRLL
jgi:hypothetical protein